jgi:hypothetical protein
VTGWYHPIEWINFGQARADDTGSGILSGWYHSLDVATAFAQPASVTGLHTDYGGSYEVYSSSDGVSWTSMGTYTGSSSFANGGFVTSHARFVLSPGTTKVHMQFIGTFI